MSCSIAGCWSVTSWNWWRQAWSDAPVDLGVDPRVVEENAAVWKPRLAQVAALLAEDQAADSRVDHVGSDEQVGIERAAVGERDTHTFGGVVDGTEAGAFEVRSRDAE